MNSHVTNEYEERRQLVGSTQAARRGEVMPDMWSLDQEVPGERPLREAEVMIDPASSPEARAAAKHDVDVAMQGLGEEGREVVRLRYFEELAPCEAARAMGCSVWAFWYRHRRAMDRMREVLDGGVA